MKLEHTVLRSEHAVLGLLYYTCFFLRSSHTIIMACTECDRFDFYRLTFHGTDTGTMLRHKEMFACDVDDANQPTNATNNNNT